MSGINEQDKIYLANLNNDLLRSRRISTTQQQLRIITSAAGGGSSDSRSAPNVIITTDAVVPLSTTFIASFTFDQVVSGFVSADVTISNGSIGSLSTSDNIVFTGTVTPTYSETGILTIQVAAGVCINSAGQSNTQSNTITLSLWDYTDVPGAFFVLDFTRTATMLQEDSASTCVTPVTSNNDPIGEMYDLSPSALHTRSLSAARRGVLSSDVNRNSYIHFDGTNDCIDIINTKKLFNKFVAASPVWTIMFWIRVNTDGAVQVIVDSNDRAAANNGIDIMIQADGTINMLMTDAGANKTNVTTTATLTTADGWIPVKVKVNGTGANASSIKIGSKTTQNFTSGSGAANDAGFDMVIGSRASTRDRPAKYDLAAMVFSNTAIQDSDTAWTQFIQKNPSRKTTEFYVLDWKYDFNDTTKLWQDSGRTTPVSANNDPIAYVDNTVTTLFGPLNKDLNTAVDVTFKTNRQNSKSCADFNGSTSSIRLQADYEAGGKWVLVKVCKNRDATNGSHVFYGSLYVPVTGNQYSGAPVFGVEYTTIHQISGAGPSANLKNQGLTVNVIVFRRNGTAFDCWSGDKVKSSQTNSNTFKVSRIGDAQIAGWEFDGEDYIDIKYNGYMSDSEIETLIIDALNSTYAI